MKHVTLVLGFLSLASCAGHPLNHEAKGRVYLLEVKASQGEAQARLDAYLLARNYLSKNFENRSVVVYLSDKKNGKIVTKLQIPCNDLKRAKDDPNQFWLEAQAEIDMRNQKIRLVLQALDYQVRTSIYDFTQEFEQTGMARCLERERDAIAQIVDQETVW